MTVEQHGSVDLSEMCRHKLQVMKKFLSCELVIGKNDINVYTLVCLRWHVPDFLLFIVA